MEHQKNAPSHSPALTDTSIEAERVQIELLRKATPARRAAIALSLSYTVFNLSRRAVQRANPNAGDFELKLLFLENCYGKDLAEKVKKYMRENPGTIPS